MGVLVQPRTKGPGHGSTSRAFYARARLVGRILGLVKSLVLVGGARGYPGKAIVVDVDSVPHTVCKSGQTPM
jgi:hypothetical protein